MPGRPVAVVRATCTDRRARPRCASPASSASRSSRGVRAPVCPAARRRSTGAITLSTERMRRRQVDPAAHAGRRSSPALLNAEVKAAAAASTGSGTRPTRRRSRSARIGGNLATNAGGLCCVKYGVTTDYVLGLEVVLADGRVRPARRATIKDVAGYDLKRLFVGSEGTLGVITEATLRSGPLPPPATTVVATFADIVAAGRAVTAIMAASAAGRARAHGRAAVAAVEAVRPMGLDVGGRAAARPERHRAPRGRRTSGDRVSRSRCDLRGRHRRPRRGRDVDGRRGAWRSRASSGSGRC